MSEKTQGNADAFLEEIEEKLNQEKKDKISFARFLEEKMDQFDYSNTSLAKKVYHRVDRKKDGRSEYVPVTRQAIGTWLRGSIPSSREIYVTLGMAFEMDVTEINHILETYMGYGLYCKNIEDAMWIALINGLFPIQQFEDVKEEIEAILQTEEESDSRSLPTGELWDLLAHAGRLEEFYQLIRTYRDEFRNGAKQFGQCLNEVIEYEYGHFEKASWFLRDIGCLHCEAQFSKIRAGKAVVTRDWLLRFCIALQPSVESIEKLLDKAQMEPLGITPMEIIIDMISRKKADSLANSQQTWILIESVAEKLSEKGYEIDEVLCRKYDSIYDLSPERKLWFAICLGKQILACQETRDFGYTRQGYARFEIVDQILFDEVNRCKKSAAFKKQASQLAEGLPQPEIPEDIPEMEMVPVCMDKETDPFDMEKFEDYCYVARPNRFSKDFLMNDTYFYSAMIYSIWTGKCFVKEEGDSAASKVETELKKAGLVNPELIAMLHENLKTDAVYDDARNVKALTDCLSRTARIGQ